MADFCGVRTAAGCCIVQIFDDSGGKLEEQMVDAKPTPGPWIACGGWVEHPDEHTADICNCYPEVMGQEYLGRSYETICANAKLIAAAPEMLEALKMFEREWDDGNLRVSAGLAEAITKAIAKAEGRE
jgi:hypothetical protein